MTKMGEIEIIVRPARWSLSHLIAIAYALSALSAIFRPLQT